MLEGRTHPEMTIHGAPGYILWGYTLCSNYCVVDAPPPLEGGTGPATAGAPTLASE